MYRHQCVLRMNSWVNRNETGRRCHNQQKHYRKDRTTKQREGKVRKRENLCEARQLQHNSADFAGLLRSILLKSREQKLTLPFSQRRADLQHQHIQPVKQRLFFIRLSSPPLSSVSRDLRVYYTHAPALSFSLGDDHLALSAD